MMSADPFVWTRVSEAGGRPALQRAGCLSPYTAQLIVDDALHAGRGGILEVLVAQDCDDPTLARVQNRFAGLRDRGLTIDVHRGRPRAPEQPHVGPEDRAA